MGRGDPGSAFRNFKEAIEPHPQCVPAVDDAAKAGRLGAKELAAAPTARPSAKFRICVAEPAAAPDVSGAAGKAVVEFPVTAEGNVVEAHAVVAAHPELAQAAEAAISHGKFHPGRRDGRTVNTLMQQPIGFDPWWTSRRSDGLRPAGTPRRGLRLPFRIPFRPAHRRLGAWRNRLGNENEGRPMSPSMRRFRARSGTPAGTRLR